MDLNELTKRHNLWVTADVQFRRPGNESVDERILSAWHESIRSGDRLFLIGNIIDLDVEGNYEWMCEKFSQVLGSARVNVVVGDNDDVTKLAKSKLFRNVDSCVDTINAAREEYGFTMSYAPIHLDALLHWHREDFHSPLVNLHGGKPVEGDDLYICATANEENEWKPIELRTLIPHIQKTRKEWRRK